MTSASQQTALGAQLAANQRQLDELVVRVGAASRRHPARAASLAQAAAEFAWFNHTGWYASPSLEAEVSRLGRSHLRRPSRLAVAPGAANTAGAAHASGPHTMHVVTQAYPTGGSTQAVASWTDEMSHRAHHLVLTRQATTPTPDKLTSRLGDRVGLTRLDTRPGTLLDRAARLRELAVRADLVLVHAHPFDVVPALAFADRSGLPPVVYVDHADHVFWLGITSVDHVMHMRVSGQDLAIERRGLDPSRSVVRNRPLAFRGRSTTRVIAKTQWDIAPNDVLILSAADPTKFHRADGPHLADLVEPVLQARPGVSWRIAGPDPDDAPWAELARRTQGRARAVGRVADMAVLHQAADLFLDSFPFASLTSLLESAAVANPVVTFRGHHESCAVFGADSPGIDHLMVRPTSPEELVQALITLVDDADLRATTGRASADAVLRSHGGAEWVAAIESLHELAPQPDSCGHAPLHGTGQVDQMTTSVMAATAHRRDGEALVAAHLGTMPPLDRLREWRGSGRPDRFRDLLPDWAIAAARSGR